MPEHDNEENANYEPGVPLTQRGEHQIPALPELPEPPPNKKVHERRPLPLVPEKPRRINKGRNRPGD